MNLNKLKHGDCKQLVLISFAIIFLLLFFSLFCLFILFLAPHAPFRHQFIANVRYTGCWSQCYFLERNDVVHSLPRLFGPMTFCSETATTQQAHGTAKCVHRSFWLASAQSRAHKIDTSCERGPYKYPSEIAAVFLPIFAEVI